MSHQRDSSLGGGATSQTDESAQGNTSPTDAATSEPSGESQTDESAQGNASPTDAATSEPSGESQTGEPTSSSPSVSSQRTPTRSSPEGGDPGREIDSECSNVHTAEEAHEGIRSEPYVVAVDIGTTNVRSHVYNKQGAIKGTSSKKIVLLHPEPGWSEMDPQLLYQQVVDCIRESVKAAAIKMNEVTCLGISTQRNTCLNWDSETGEPFHNLVTWQDLRAREYVKTWNQSYMLKLVNGGSRFVHTFTRKKRYLAASVLKFMSSQVTLRLLWLLDNIPKLRQKASEGQVMFGCIETWLLYKLTGGTEHATDYSCASSTGLYDAFQIEWSPIVCGLVNIPLSIFPEVKPTSGLFGHTDEAIFGHSIPITCLVGDQSASMFGECCFDVGDIKCTLGTGTFIDLNTGKTPHASVAGLYPLIGWVVKDEMTYIAEGMASDTGAAVNWAQSIGLFEDVRDTADIATSVPDTSGVYFVPAFSGLQAPINDDKACTLMLGIQPSTTKAHMVRALLESICFRFKLLYETVLVETKIPLSHIRVNGGVCNNDFIVQLMADLTNQVIDRSKQTENMGSLGTAFFAGLEMGVWKDKEELREIRQTDHQFEPQQNWAQYKNIFHQWERAVSRCRQWYQ